MEELKLKHWERLSKNIELGLPYMKCRILELCDLVLAELKDVSVEINQPGFNIEAVTELERLIRGRAIRCMKTV